MDSPLKERGKRKEESGKRKEERGKRKEERGKRKEERGKRKEDLISMYRGALVSGFENILVYFNKLVVSSGK